MRSIISPLLRAGEGLAWTARDSSSTIVRRRRGILGIDGREGAEGWWEARRRDGDGDGDGGDWSVLVRVLAIPQKVGCWQEFCHAQFKGSRYRGGFASNALITSICSFE